MGFHLYLIRHAQSENNAVPESRRVEDPGITQLGVRQAALLAERFRQSEITHLFTSGFRRAVETTRPLAKALGLTPEIWTELHEVGGCYRGYLPNQREGRPGLTRETLKFEFPEFRVPADIDNEGWWKCKPFESFDQAMERAQTQAKKLCGEFFVKGAIVACVIHADIKNMLLNVMLKDSYADFANLRFMNTSVTLLEFNTRKPTVIDFNDGSHLPIDLVSS